MSDILEELTALRCADAARKESEVPFEEMMRRAVGAAPARDFAAALRGGRSELGRFRVIAELKRASPSEGMIRPDFDAAALARGLEKAGAAALSVLCEPHRFLGGEAFLRIAHQETGLPILYKDFISTRYQIATARAAGADAVLLIAAVLDDAALADLLGFASSLGMAALVETHCRDEISRAADAGAAIVGVNCRNLRDFSCNTSLLERLVGDIPEACVRVAESGMRDAASIGRARAAGADAFLVGTALMRAASPALMLEKLLGNLH